MGTNVLGENLRRCSLLINQNNMEESQMTEKILTLALKIICLLTGEDYTVVKKRSGECVTPSSHTDGSGGWSKTQRPIAKESPSHSLIHERSNDEKILELTYKIIELLTGEVPIRCLDVTVYLSMEEWEYLEEHKDLYKDVMMKDHQPFTSPGLPPKRIKEEPVFGDGEILTEPTNYTFSDHTQHYALPRIKEETASWDEENMHDPKNCLPRDHTQLYSPTHIKEEPDSQQQKCITDPIIYTHIMEEAVSCDVENSTPTNVYTSSGNKQEYPSPHVREEPAPREEGQFTDPEIYTLTDPIKGKPVSCDDGEHSAATNISTDCTHQYPTVYCIKESVTCERRKLSGPTIYTPQYSSMMEESVSYDAGNLTDINIYSSRDQPVLSEGENLYNNYGYIFTEHTYTHLNRNIFPLGAERFVDDLMDSLPRVVGASTSLEGFCTEEGLAELQYVSNHVRSPDWSPAKAKNHGDFLSKCIEYEKHFCKVSHARICGTHLTEWSFNCSECQNCLNTTLKLIRQNLKHQEAKEKPVKKSSSFAERHTEKKEFACLDCGKHFPNKRYLLTHRRVHSEENPFHCPACGQNFEDQQGFLAHQTNPGCERPFSCSECGKQFKSKYNSEYHKKIHTENKKYLCPVCGKSFRKQSCFIVHERTHTGEKPYACPECGRCFSQNASLISHQRLHTGEKPFTCLECGRNFTQRISLVVHQRVHSGDRPYKCQECGKGFTQRIGLVQHQRRHTGEKPFTCSECGKSFTLHDSLVKHLRTHTGEKPYICSECGKRFCQSSQLTAHKRFHHASQHNFEDNV
ncbi:oocyte zinc finger protein XlCOF7.1-like [Bufo gargarizans]|uniref:oocyte zinc finger protein XlCOF7.1-like n=1 Tax=Bufo gargarizans TaxID=30331 RepID=UPI001CF49D65|nr:oocyte zinc finger protein XlCOF7.1-like [Bufo gargarizans]